MSSIDLSPFYRNSIGYDRVGALIDSALRSADSTSGYPPYNIEVLDQDRYAITLAVAGFRHEDLKITVENNVLTVAGSRDRDVGDRRYLHQGIANRAFERRFNLAEHVEVTDADLSDGMLNISLKREVPDAMKPRTIPIGGGDSNVLEHSDQAA
ncbi:Hsp20 family protein [Seongchinamella unica]|uniref:Hsp20 family protein n=1 Tax=Seongchinamella unica TaxID=2547392 RepID=A0A4R5LRM1_9GAMM|nr:Hsp20 family protein [Seongchinamella unica]TDG13480.1 Hsp20 family protein [Seongchinamella unica]